MVTPHVMMPEGRKGVNCGNYNQQIGGEFVPLVDAAPGRRVTAAELRDRPDSKHIDAAIRGINDTGDDYEAKQDVQRIVREFCDNI